MNFKEGDIIKLPETREVLFEKYSKEIMFSNFFDEKLNGCVVKTDNDITEHNLTKTYKTGYTYFFKNNEYVMELFVFTFGDSHNFYCRDDNFYDVLMLDYGFKYNEIKQLVKDKVQHLFPGLEIITALYSDKERIRDVEEKLGL